MESLIVNREYELTRICNGGERKRVGVFKTYDDAERRLMQLVDDDINHRNDYLYLPTYDILER